MPLHKKQADIIFVYKPDWKTKPMHVQAAMYAHKFSIVSSNIARV